MLVFWKKNKKKSTPPCADNISVIGIASDLVYDKQTKHIDVYAHFIGDLFHELVITLPHVATNMQLVDIFTKAMTTSHHLFCVDKPMLTLTIAWKGVWINDAYSLFRWLYSNIRL